MWAERLEVEGAAGLLHIDRLRAVDGAHGFEDTGIDIGGDVAHGAVGHNNDRPPAGESFGSQAAGFIEQRLASAANRCTAAENPWIRERAGASDHGGLTLAVCDVLGPGDFVVAEHAGPWVGARELGSDNVPRVFKARDADEMRERNAGKRIAAPALVVVKRVQELGNERASELQVFSVNRFLKIELIVELLVPDERQQARHPTEMRDRRIDGVDTADSGEV